MAVVPTADLMTITVTTTNRGNFRKPGTVIIDG